MIAQEVIVAKSQEIHRVVDKIVTVVADAVYVPAAGLIEMTTPPASPTAATSNGPADGAMSKLVLKVPACNIMEKDSDPHRAKAPELLHGTSG